MSLLRAFLVAAFLAFALPSGWAAEKAHAAAVEASAETAHTEAVVVNHAEHGAEAAHAEHA